jgi:sensor histidine kinase regulating citrate/malate metabolism
MNKRPGFGNRPVRVKNKIMALTIFILTITLSVVCILVERVSTSRIESRFGQHALDLAHAVAELEPIQKNVGKPDGHLVIQPIADGIRKKTQAEFIVVIDMNGVRYSHSVPNRIGKTIVGGDEGPALQGMEYTSKAVGTLGPSLRAFVPLYNDGEQVGAVAVGIMMTEVNALKGELRRWILFAVILGLLIGILGSNYLADNIKKAIFGLEPHEIAAMHNEREALLEAIREGILAVDNNGSITVINSEARRILGVEKDVQGWDVTEVIPNIGLVEVINTGKAEYDQEQRIRGTRIMTNRVPIKLDDHVIGAIASIRDMTEVKAMAEELTGVKKYVEALRIQNHEFSNKLHAIAGMIQLGEYEKAVDDICNYTTSQQSIISFITRRIKDPSIAGLILSKSGRCKELGIELVLDEESYLGPLKNIDSSTMVIIVGNLLENAIEAVNDQRSVKKIFLTIKDMPKELSIIVKDTGPGIPDSILSNIYDKGFTTKGAGNRGFGLHLVKAAVESYNGEISLKSSPDQMTVFEIRIPKEMHGLEGY